MISLFLFSLCLPQLQIDQLDDGLRPEILVGRVREQLEVVNDALDDAMQADVVTDQLGRALDGHRQIIRSLEALISQVRYSTSGSSPSRDQPTQNQGHERESDGSQAPRPDEQQPGPDDTQGELPRSPDGGQPREGPADGTLSPDATEVFTRDDWDDRWGLLPPKLQERLMNLHVQNIPERYRRRLEAYIHALQAEEDGSDWPRSDGRR